MGSTLEGGLESAWGIFSVEVLSSEDKVTKWMSKALTQT